jgi:hypothetical protein
MKKLILCVALIAAISVPAAFSQLRFEIGANVPVAAALLSGGELSEDTIPLIGEDIFVAVPNSSLLLQIDLGLFKLGAGVKVQSLMLMAYAAYPNAQLEIALGPLCLDASLGGYYMGFYAIGEGFGYTELDALIPEVSAWLAFGKKKAFRIGAGAIGLLPTSFDLSDVPMILYGGMKIVLE